MYCWGRNDYGGLGDGTTDNRYSPVKVVGTTFPEGCTGEFIEENNRCWIPALSN